MTVQIALSRRVLVTGGAGFLGARLVATLLRRGYTVVVLDNCWTGPPTNLGMLKNDPGLTFIEGDVRDPIPDDIERCDQIYHLACPASPPQFTKEPIRILDTCYIGTRNVLEKARQWKARVLLASTSEIYGQAERTPQDESYLGNVNCFGPRACYDEGKRVAEALAYSYRLKYAGCLEIRIARVFNSYGPGMHAEDGRVVCSFIGAALRGRELVVNGDGNSTRCFQYVDDCVAGLESLMESRWEGGPMNLGCEQETTINELARLIASAVSAITGRPEAPIVHEAALPDDPVHRRPDSSLAREALGWTASTGLEEGLQRTIDWHLGLESSDL